MRGEDFEYCSGRRTGLPRFGLCLFLPRRMDTVRHFGLGPPGELRRQASRIPPRHVHRPGCGPGPRLHPPQENGSRADCDLVELSGLGLALAAGGAHRFSFNAPFWPQEELIRAGHDTELEPCGSTVLCLDAAVSGIGSNSCGPALLERYRVDDAERGLNLLLIPATTN